MKNIELLQYFRIVKPYIKNSRKQIVLVFILSCCITISGLISPLVSQNLIDRVFIQDDYSFLHKLIILMIIAFIIITVINLSNSYLAARLTEILNYRIRLDFFDKLQNSELLFNISKKTGEIQYRMFEDTQLLVDYFLKICINTVMYIIWLVILILLMLNWSYPLTALVVVSFLAQVILVIKFKKPFREMSYIKKGTEQEVVACINEHFLSIELIKTLNLEKDKYKYVSEKLNKLMKVQIKTKFLGSIYQALSSIINQFWSYGVLLIGGTLVYNKDLSLGTFMGFYILAGMLNQPVSSLTGIILSYQDVKVSFYRYMEYYDKAVKPDIEAIEEFKLDKDIRLQNIWVEYDNKLEVLKDVNLMLTPGKIYALIGESGAGKTTLARCLTRLINVKRGEIFIDGIQQKYINMESYRKNVGYMLQNSFVMDGTLFDNITLGLKDVSEETVIEVVEKAGLSNFIERMPEGLKTPLGNRGVEISLGEAQRIALARLLLRKPKLIIFDEPTSFIDKETEKIIHKSIIELKEKYNALIIIIAHKQSSIDIADEIYMVEDGSISKI